MRTTDATRWDQRDEKREARAGNVSGPTFTSAAARPPAVGICKRQDDKVLSDATAKDATAKFAASRYG